MKSKHFFILTCLIVCITATLNAQTSMISSDSSSLDSDKAKAKSGHNKNFIKINLTAIALKNYSIQYERVLNKSISIAVAFRSMPSTSIPFKHLILKAVNDDADTKKVIDNFRISDFAFTPEIRFYLSKKGYGRGFYIAPFYRYANFKATNLIFDYQNILSQQSSINLSGKLTSNTGGILFGTQSKLGKHMCFDLWLFGPHYGAGKGDFTGVSSKPLTPAEQNDLRQKVEDLDIHLTHKTVNVNANGAALSLRGPWGGIRGGISLGVKF
jgi:hypothetical protein